MLFQSFLNRIGFRKTVETLLTVKRKKPVLSTYELFVCLISLAVLGIERLSHAQVLAEDKPVGKILGLERFPSGTILWRFLLRMGLGHVAQISRISASLLNKIQRGYDRLPRATLDLDSTVLTVYGKQAGVPTQVGMGYNPHKPGKRSYRPLLCFIAETGDYLYGKLRRGDAAEVAGIIPFMRKALAKLPEGVAKVAVRADAGFYSGAFFDFLEARGIAYAVVARITTALGLRLLGIPYKEVAPGIEVGELFYQALGWSKERRCVVIRKALPRRPDNQLVLWSLLGSSYQVIATNMAENSPEEVWSLYKGRAQVENRIEEVKNQLHLSRIPSGDFVANACYFQIVLLAYNLVNWFRRLVLSAELRRAEIETLRWKILTIAAKVVERSRQVVIALSQGFSRKWQFYQGLEQIGALEFR